MKKIWDKYKSAIIVALFLIAIFSGFIALGYRLGYNKGQKDCKVVYTHPVEKEVIDTLYITRYKIINKIQYLETVKHDTIQKVYVLDDSSTLELFYKLVSEQYYDEPR